MKNEIDNENKEIKQMHIMHAMVKNEWLNRNQSCSASSLLGAVIAIHVVCVHQSQRRLTSLTN